jgi:hypothetical protein
MNRTLLIKKLEERTGKKYTTKLLRNILGKIFIQIDDTIATSQTLQQTNKVLQGDHLSLLLFITATADIIKAIQNEKNVKFYAYADDMVLIAKSVESLQTAFNNVIEWGDKNEMLLNRTKTVIRTFRKGGSRAITDRILYGEEPLELVTEFKYLGIIFQLNGRNFTNHVRERAASAIAASHGTG